jgi:hypothetical protein
MKLELTQAPCWLVIRTDRLTVAFRRQRRKSVIMLRVPSRVLLKWGSDQRNSDERNQPIDAATAAPHNGKPSSAELYQDPGAFRNDRNPGAWFLFLGIAEGAPKPGFGRWALRPAGCLHMSYLFRLCPRVVRPPFRSRARAVSQIGVTRPTMFLTSPCLLRAPNGLERPQ